MITLSGHPLYLKQLATRYARVISERDKRLDVSQYVQSLYQKAGIAPPPKPKLRWHLEALDLGLLR